MIPTLLTKIILGINYFSLIYVILISTIYLIQLICAAIGLRKYTKSLKYTDYKRFQESDYMVPISVLVPAYNEEATIVDNTRNLLSLSFPQHEVIVINDGSKDGTLGALKESFHLIPSICLLRDLFRQKTLKQFIARLIIPTLLFWTKKTAGRQMRSMRGLMCRCIRSLSLLMRTLFWKTPH